MANKGEEVHDVESNPFQRETDPDARQYIKRQEESEFFIRNFTSPTQRGIRSSFVTLFSGTVGPGLLSLPKVLSNFGLCLGLACFGPFGLLTLLIYHIINGLITKSGKRSYANLVSFYLGRRIAKFMAQFLIFVMVATGILYASVIWQFAYSLMNNLKIVEFKFDHLTGKIEQYGSLTVRWRYICCLGFSILIIPIM